MSRDESDDNLRPRGPSSGGPGAGDDPDAPPTEEELRAAGALRDELEAPAPRSSEAAWLRAHLRPSTWEDSLGEVRARGLARAAREGVLQRRAAQAPLLPAGLPPWRQLRRGLAGTIGLVASAVLLLVVSSVMLDQAGRPAVAELQRVQQAQLLRASLQLKESPTQRLDLVIEDRLQALRQAGYRARARRAPGLALARGALP